MENDQKNGDYQVNDADTLVGQLFSGGITVGEAIERLRTRLLDLSARKRLIKSDLNQRIHSGFWHVFNAPPATVLHGLQKRIQSVRVGLTVLPRGADRNYSICAN